MQSKKDSNDMPLGSLRVTDTELPDGSAVFNFEGSDEDFELIVKTGIRDIIRRDLLGINDFLAPNFDELDEEEQFTNYFFAHTVKTGLMNMLEDFEKEKQKDMFE
jgi:hypothetical protein